MSNTKSLMDANDAGKILLLSSRRVRTMARDGRLPHVVLPGGELRFTEADLLAWIDARKRPATKGGTK